MAIRDEIALARETAETQSVEAGQRFEEGFTLRTAIGTLFIAFIMLPGALYLGLVAGQGLGPAAQWVTIVLFAEVARRSFAPLKKQEIYILFYVASSLTVLMSGGIGLSGGPFGWLIWNQYFIQSPPATPIANQIPTWAVPRPDSLAILHRTFFHRDWLIPIVLLVTNEIFGRMMWMGLGYTLFRVTNDVERLPFPMAPVAASGATALAEAGRKEESWRWRVFSTGAVVGLVYGFFYLAIPIFTSVLFGKAFMLIPIPFFDLVPNTEHILPAALTGLSGDLGLVLTGFVIPAPIVIGSATASILCQVFTNPILQRMGLLPDWYPGMSTIQTSLTVNMNFWLSVGIGVQLAVAFIGIIAVVRVLVFRKQLLASRGSFSQIPAGRGDKASTVYIAIGAWLVATVGVITIAHQLVPGFPLWIFIFFGLVWTPINSYISARMIALTGQGVSFPYLREATILKTGYDRVDIWYAPMPLADHGWAAQRFREVELTGTRFTSILYAEAFMLPVVLLASFLFWAFFWHTSQIPSAQYPYAQKFWPLHAQMNALWQQINLKGSSTGQWLLRALRTDYIIGGFTGGLALFGIFSVLRLPLLFYYGFVGGIGALPHHTIPMLLGTILGHRYFARRFGAEQWRLWAPVLLAGFSCGMGLIGMAAIALAIIGKSVSYLPY